MGRKRTKRQKHRLLELIASMNEEDADKPTIKPKNEIEMKKIGNKLSFLSPITEFQTQNPFRKPSDSSPQIPVIKPHNLNNALFLVHITKSIALFLVHIDDIEYGHGTTIPL